MKMKTILSCHLPRLCLHLIASAMAAAPAAALETPAQAPDAEQLVGALNQLYGVHPGRRASQARGICAAGAFIPAPSASGIVKSPLFARPSVPAVVRLSIGGGNPDVSDKLRSVRGLSARLYDGAETYDLALQSEPVFFAATPASFVSFLEAHVPDPATGRPDPQKIAAHFAAHPDGRLQPSLLAAHAAPASYATTPYYSTNAFVFENAAGTGQGARIVVEPAAGRRYLSAQEEKDFPDRYLEGELAARLEKGAVAFAVFAQLPAPGDSMVDPSQLWRGAGKVALGTLQIRTMAAADTCDPLVFIPLRLPDGMAPSDDPVLKARTESYSLSHSRRED
jgi:catalase